MKVRLILCALCFFVPARGFATDEVCQPRSTQDILDCALRNHPEVAQAQAILKQMKATVLGCILTHVEYYLSGYYRYYHEYHYGATKDGNGSAKRQATSNKERSKADKVETTTSPVA